jgi:oligosaccharide repeat unit polymerase
MSAGWFESWIPASLLGLCAMAARLRFGAWLHPACFVMVVWTAIICLPLVFGPDFPVSPSAVWCMVGLILAVAIGAASTAPQRSVNTRERTTTPPAVPRIEIRLGLLRAMVICTVVCGVVYCIRIVRIVAPAAAAELQGFKTDAVSAAANEASVDRYSDSPTSADTKTQLLSTFVYTSAALAGILFCLKRTWIDAVLCGLAFVPVFVSSFLSGTRMGIGTDVMLYAGFYQAARVALPNLAVRRRRAGRLLVLAVFGVFAALALSTVIDDLRTAHAPSLGSVGANLLSKRTRATFFGHVSTFSTWFDQSWEQSNPPALGTYTLSGPLNWLGIHNRAKGLYIDAAQILPDGTSSNIYTVLRSVIDDYSIGGAVGVLWLCGAIAGWCYEGVQRGRHRRGPWLAVFYWSAATYVTTVFVYNTLTFGTGLAIIGWLLVIRPAATARKRFPMIAGIR